MYPVIAVKSKLQDEVELTVKKSEAEAIAALAGERVVGEPEGYESAFLYIRTWISARGEGKMRNLNTRRRLNPRARLHRMTEEALRERETGFQLAERLLAEAAAELSKKK